MSESSPNSQRTEAPSDGELGTRKGGIERAKRLTSDERAEIARAGAMARWKRVSDVSDVAVATHGGSLHIAGVDMPCYVLEDGRRIIAQRAVIRALGMSRGHVGDRLAHFASSKTLKPFIGSMLEEGINKPILFRPPQGSVSYGYEASILADLCDAVLAARESGSLKPQQLHIAKQCEVLVRGFARVGIIALVDEATGYQAVRARDALARILERFISTELRRWVRTFPPDFYEELFRLQGWQYPMDAENASKRPMRVGQLTDDLVYKRLAPGVRDELRRLTPRDDAGRLKHKLHQRLSENHGSPRLREHLAALVALMRASDNWKAFKRAADRALPRYDKTLELGLEDA